MCQRHKLCRWRRGYTVNLWYMVHKSQQANTRLLQQSHGAFPLIWEVGILQFCKFALSTGKAPWSRIADLTHLTNTDLKIQYGCSEHQKLLRLLNILFVSTSVLFMSCSISVQILQELCFGICMDEMPFHVIWSAGHQLRIANNG